MPRSDDETDVPVAPTRRPLIHLVTSLRNYFGGGERRTLGMFQLLEPHADVVLWSSVPPDQAFFRHPLRIIDASRDEYPLGGTLVLVGVEESIQPWIERTAPERFVIVYNSSDPRYLRYVLNTGRAFGLPQPELVFASEVLQKSVGLPGTVQWGPDLDRFHPSAPWSGHGQFAVGRLSRDHPLKHNLHDVRLYRALAANGFDVRIMGGRSLASRFRQADGVLLLPTGAVPARQFLQSLHAFVYRVHSGWFEPSGRVVAEAMATGLPVVCHVNGGYRELIRDGESGFLFTSTNEALEILERLRADPPLSARVGAAARAEIEQRFGAVSRQQLVDFYCNPSGFRPRARHPP
jgi:glycosyltransferase involved in cell wall biosynthesis